MRLVRNPSLCRLCIDFRAEWSLIEGDEINNGPYYFILLSHKEIFKIRDYTCIDTFSPDILDLPGNNFRVSCGDLRNPGKQQIRVFIGPVQLYPLSKLPRYFTSFFRLPCKNFGRCMRRGSTTHEGFHTCSKRISRIIVRGNRSRCTHSWTWQ